MRPPGPITEEADFGQELAKEMDFLMADTIKTASDSRVIPIIESEIETLLQKEWLLANRRGSYVSGTVLGCNTRRYHGLLIASLHPPVERFVTLSNLLETVTIGERKYELSNFEFSDRLHPQGYRYLKEFRRDTGVHFCYELDGLTVEKSIYLAYEQDLVAITYQFSGAAQELQFSLMPLVALRDFHGLQSSSTSLNMEVEHDLVTARVMDPHGPAVHLYCDKARFERGADWWYAMHYRQETARGQHDYEDVWAPGHFRAALSAPATVTLCVQATTGLQRPGPLHEVRAEELAAALQQRTEQLCRQAQARDADQQALVKAADQFIVKRNISESQESVSILAGFHWFADWGRDTFIGLPGLLLRTGREAEAREVLLTFAQALDQGMIPSRFDDYGGAPHYNAVDASLWFIHSAYQYLLATGDQATYQEKLLPVLAEIVRHYQDGTRFHIHADDGLISAGDPQTQLTWMDARCNGISFTPRHGKPVEINALWINALHIMAETAADSQEREKFARMAGTAEQNFVRLFWNVQNNCLHDCILSDGTVDAAIRPNQIFAVSLPFSPLDEKYQLSVVQVVRDELLTPYGLRSLSPRDSRYRGRYSGNQFQRDSAYHQGTVWAFLIGPFVEAYLKVHRFSQQARSEAAEMIEPLLRHLNEDACLGSVSEIFDGDWPHRPNGCVAQAWSIAELLRAKLLIQS